MQGYSLLRVVMFLTTATSLGLVFLICWLVFVDSTDIQTAFTPVGFIMTMVMVVMAVPQFMGLA